MEEVDIKSLVEKSDMVFYHERLGIIKDKKSIIVGKDFLYDCINKNLDKNRDFEKFWQYINIYFGIIVELSEKSKNIPHLKGSMSDRIVIKVKEKQYSLSYCVSDEQIRAFYTKFKKECFDILNIE